MIGAGRRGALKRGRGTVEGTFACTLIDADSKSASHDEERMLSLGSCLKSKCLQPNVSRLHLSIERGDCEYVLEVAVIWRVPLFDPARREAIVSILWWSRGAMRLWRRLVGWVITLALGLALVRGTRGLRAWSLLMGICLGSLIEVVHILMKEEVMKERWKGEEGSERKKERRKEGKKESD